MWKLVIYLIPSALAITGLLQTALYIFLKKRFHEFGVVVGEVTYSRFLNYTDPDGKREIGAIIKFKYKAGGLQYEADSPALKGYEMFPSFNYYNQLVKRYPPGEIVNVHFLRSNPKIAYLEIAPLSKLSTILAPLISVASIGVITAYFYGVGDYISEYLGNRGGLATYIEYLLR